MQAHAAVVSTLSAKQRVATFLLEMSARWEQRGYSKHAFVLFMSRDEIGNFLGLTFETVSRTLSYFQANKWVSVKGKNVLIRDLQALQSQLKHPTMHIPVIAHTTTPPSALVRDEIRPD